MHDTLIHALINAGFNENNAELLTKAIIIVGILLVSFLANLITKKVILRIVMKVVQKTKTTWDDTIAQRGVLTRLSHLAPSLVVYFLIKIPFPQLDNVTEIIKRLAVAYMIGVVASVFSAILNAVQDIYSTYRIAKSRPIKGYIQVVKIAVIIVAVILVVTTLLNKSPLGILGGIGAMSAVLLLVFKDSILGLVASIQLSANNMVRIGDWIEMPKYGADGDVIEITLQSVKVQNWDKTIATIPIYALVNDSFKNWRGMQESGGRRIKRAVNIDMHSIQFCTEEMVGKYRRIEYLKDYIESKTKEIEEHNTSKNITPEDLINGRHLTNIGTFRAYLSEYVRRHPKINTEMTCMVRQLPPGREGLPLEIYVFSSDQVWVNYEGIQADIFDHILAVLPEFDLRVFQDPGSSELNMIAEALRKK